eukprot:g12361.t1
MKKDADWMRLLIMREARTNGAAAACKKYGVPYWKARYLEMKSFGAHPNKDGGRRYSTLTPAAQLLLEWSAFIIWSEAPRNGDYQVMQMLKEHLGWDWMEGGPDGSARTRVHRIRKNVLKFTDKKASVTNPKKYTIGNILKMYQYLDWVRTIPRSIPTTGVCISTRGFGQSGCSIPTDTTSDTTGNVTLQGSCDNMLGETFATSATGDRN